MNLRTHTVTRIHAINLPIFEAVFCVKGYQKVILEKRKGLETVQVLKEALSTTA
jgi:hypothetical protein